VNHHEDMNALIHKELDALGQENHMSNDQDTAHTSGEEQKKGKKKRGKKLFLDKKVFLLAGITLLFSCVGAYLLTAWFKTEEIKESEVERFAIIQNPPLAFSPFIIPYPPGRDFTYASLSLSFMVSERRLRNELIERMEELRGIIYESLWERFQQGGEAQTPENLKSLILEEVNRALFSGKVTEVYIDHFISV
jgi:flagellar basal body-associated protein FliL